ncbi:unnamed protein product, partial [Symbiodinium sp. CCMP2456]
MAAEGLFISLAIHLEEADTDIRWSWAEAGAYIAEILGDMSETDDRVKSRLADAAKQHSDHVRVTTGNKVWRAHWTRRVADMLAQLRKSWENEQCGKTLSKLFLTECDTPMPSSVGVCFKDVYLNDNWDVVPKSPQANCYLKLDYVFFYESECLQMIHDLKNVHEDLERDTQWLSVCLSGGNLAPPGSLNDNVEQYNQLISAVHASTPNVRQVKQYLIQKVDALPGCVMSSKGKRTKMMNFIEALDSSEFVLFKQVDAHTFHKLLVDWAKLSECMQSHGGVDVFGGWVDWGCPFEHMHTQEKWDGSAFEEQRRIMLRHRTPAGDVAAVGRTTQCIVSETVDLQALQQYA